MLNFFVRLEVQRRYFNIVSVEMLSKSFGMKQPSSMDTLMDRNTRINLDRLIKNGRSITVENYLQAKDELDANPREREELLNDRETFIVRPK
jgi:type IV secretory pathway TrbF-like protein